jgi:hypothetical protein
LGIPEDKTGRAYSIHGSGKKYVQNFEGKETSWKSEVEIGRQQ